jgi:hypothetical protein
MQRISKFGAAHETAVHDFALSKRVKTRRREAHVTQAAVVVPPAWPGRVPMLPENQAAKSGVKVSPRPATYRISSGAIVDLLHGKFTGSTLNPCLPGP